MKATTIKVEDPLLEELNSMKPKEKSLSSFVRDILDGEVRRMKLISAADRYTAFLDDHPEEREWLTSWEEAPLEHAPKRTAKRRTS